MSLEDVQKAAVALPREDRKRLIGFLLDFNRTPEQRAQQQRIFEAMDDKDPSRWVTLDEFKDRVEKRAAELGNE